MKSIIGAVFFAVTLAVAPAASAQVTVQQAQSAFVEGVGFCAKAVINNGGIASLAESERARLGVANDKARGFVHAEEGRPVWTVLSARDIVFVVERNTGGCDVAAFGPPTAPTFASVAALLQGADLGFAEITTPEEPGSVVRRFHRTVGERRLLVRLDGREPAPGGLISFPVLFAFVNPITASP